MCNVISLFFVCVLSLSVAHVHNSSLVITDSVTRRTSQHSIMDILEENHGSILLPDFRSTAKAMQRQQKDSNNPFFAFLINICEKLNGYHTLFSIYSSVLHIMPLGMVGPSIIAYETFLDAFEHAVAPYVTKAEIIGTEGGDNDMYQLPPQAMLALPQVSLVNWPKDKHIILHIDNVAESSTYLYENHIQGLSNALDRLGMLTSSRNSILY